MNDLSGGLGASLDDHTTTLSAATQLIRLAAKWSRLCNERRSLDCERPFRDPTWTRSPSGESPRRESTEGVSWNHSPRSSPFASGTSARRCSRSSFARRARSRRRPTWQPLPSSSLPVGPHTVRVIQVTTGPRAFRTLTPRKDLNPHDSGSLTAGLFVVPVGDHAGEPSAALIVRGVLSPRGFSIRTDGPRLVPVYTGRRIQRLLATPLGPTRRSRVSTPRGPD